MRKATVVVLALAVLVLVAGAFAAGWAMGGESDADLIGSCAPTDKTDRYDPETDLVCSSNDAVLAHEQEHSVVCYREEQYGIGGRGVYRCKAEE
jgi:hypothetical protein